ncbi:GMC family oxidoreductase [Roseisalinus antarcticus]|uniref:Fructose dehydrogenase large subunit n=1 Tax=Roseisalinus antarcticus TaxID=254357 RepID=A0A1Y5SZA9_9RHOB|nr:GMC family oxidoreductase [Roseisalinus antarcticus]SLN52157.1 Fructose dehydrogenase large subunit [Roseisalinus antarcticus]
MTTNLSSPPLTIPPEVAFGTEYDVAIVGSGVSGAIIAKRLGAQGFRVLVIEAGSGRDITVSDYAESVERFYTTVGKDNNAPYALNPDAPMPRDYHTKKLNDGETNDQGYLVQRGPLEIDSTYSRVLGGTTRHWEAKALRMVPDDFRMRTTFGQGRDWPVSYDDLEPYYREAERELGVSGDVEHQRYAGLTFPEGYVLPMHRMPPSYLDQVMARDLAGMEITLGDESWPLEVRSTPQARNGIPNRAYDNGKGYVPTGAVSLHQAEMGGRCQGNTNCVPICPVQAKYDARKTLGAALGSGNVHLLGATVATRVEIDEVSGRVTAIECLSYGGRDRGETTAGKIRAKTFVLAANAVENPRLMLASGLAGRAGLMGRNLMDHVYLLTWALMPEVVGAGRGPLCTSGIEDMRTGGYRARQAAVRFSIHNDGWGWATGAPYTDLEDLLEMQNKFGADLRRGLVDRVSRQLLLDCMIEVLPDESNRISVDPAFRDAHGNMRPVLSFDVGSYTLETAAFSRRLTRQIFQRLGAEDHTRYDPRAPGYVTHDGEGYVLRGGNHWAGTHMMGTNPASSVVDAHQRSWDHANLFLAGAGSMASIGTANTTLTLSALCLRTAEAIARDLGTGTFTGQTAGEYA